MSMNNICVLDGLLDIVIKLKRWGITKMINIASPIIESEEIDAVNRVLESGMIAQGPVVADLEAEFAKYCGTKFAVAVNSGTAAIHAALHGVGVRPGDEVITTPFSFIATINPILMQGATVKLADIREDDFTIDPIKVKQAITPRTKAILAVDLYGQAYDYKALSAIASDANAHLIEDACQAVGAEYDGMRTGGLGAVGCFSLYATKNIMSGEGGMLTTDNEEIAAAAKRFRQHGMTAPYEYAELGFNYRMTDLQGAIALEQLKKSENFKYARQRNASIFDEGLKGIAGIVLPIVR